MKECAHSLSKVNIILTINCAQRSPPCNKNGLLLINENCPNRQFTGIAMLYQSNCTYIRTIYRNITENGNMRYLVNFTNHLAKNQKCHLNLNETLTNCLNSIVVLYVTSPYYEALYNGQLSQIRLIVLPLGMIIRFCVQWVRCAQHGHLTIRMAVMLTIGLPQANLTSIICKL